MVFIGVDPGVGGGIAVIDSLGNEVEAFPMPKTDATMLGVLQIAGLGTGGSHLRFAMLERVRSSPQMGVVSAFTFGGNYRALRMALTACQIPFDEVVPQKWQRALGCLSGGDKNVTKQRAEQLFPRATITHALADAFLLAEYCRRQQAPLGAAATKIARPRVTSGGGGISCRFGHLHETVAAASECSNPRLGR